MRVLKNLKAESLKDSSIQNKRQFNQSLVRKSSTFEFWIVFLTSSFSAA
jgi:hypothetical protein